MEYQNEPLVSIIIPSYKGSSIIGKTLDGVKNQTYKNIEIIVVDDNGIGTEEQFKTQNVVEKYKKVRYIAHEENKRGSAARNTGIRVSSGRYIAFLDDDDIWHSQKIEKQVDMLEKTDNTCGLVYGPFVMVYEDGTAEIIKNDCQGGLYDFLIGKIRIGSSLMMIKREVIKKVGEFDETFVRHQDWEFITRIAQYYKMSFSSDAWTIKYVTRRNSPNQIEIIENNRLYFLDKMKSIINSLSPQEQKTIYSYHYTFLAKENLRRKRIKRCIYWLRKTSNCIFNGFKLILNAFSMIIRKRKQVKLSTLLEKENILFEDKNRWG